MPSRIARLYANNYRCLVNFELTPGRRSLLLGYNGSGKSSVFDVLLAVHMLVIGGSEAKEAFPVDTVTKFTGSNKQRFELDVQTDRGTLHYELALLHDMEKKIAAITLEALTLDDRPAYRFADGEVHLYGDDGNPLREPFPASPQRSFLAALEPKAQSPAASFKEFVDECWPIRLEPARIGAVAPREEAALDTDAVNFASWCRHVLQENPDHIQRAQETLREIIPGFQRLRMQSAGRAKVLVTTFRYPEGDAYDLDFNTLSDGQKVLFVLYVLLHDVARSTHLLCLDEPDNFVSLREIQPFLVELDKISDETGLQVLLVSHSPEVIDYVGASDAILLERLDGGFTRVRTIEAKGTLRLSELMARGWLPRGSDETE